jgi:DNA repair protein RadC
MRVYEAKLVYSLVSLGEDVRLNSPQTVCDYLRDYFEANPVTESFVTILLDRKHHSLARHVVTTGTATSSLAHPREVFKAAILASATAIICAHNHPSGDPAPSAADLQITRQLREASKALDIDLVDHVIIGDQRADPKGVGYYSFRESGVL